MVHVLPRRLAALAPALLLVAAGCGPSRQAKLFDELEKECNTATTNGWTLNQTLLDLRGYNVSTNLACRPDLGNLPPPQADNCGTATADNLVCNLFLEWGSTDPSLCNPGGGCCLLCELRVKKSDFDAKGGDSPVCASRAAQGQVCQ
jgi:hypothetical protein